MVVVVVVDDVVVLVLVDVVGAVVLVELVGAVVLVELAGIVVLVDVVGAVVLVVPSSSGGRVGNGVPMSGSGSTGSSCSGGGRTAPVLLTSYRNEPLHRSHSVLEAPVAQLPAQIPDARVLGSSD